MRYQKFFSLCLCVWCLLGCAEIPSVDYELMRAKDARNPNGHLALLRQQEGIIGGVPFVGGNKVELLRNGAATYPAMLAAIKTAHRRIDMESYTFDDREGEMFADALLQRRRAGVEVNVIYDAWGSSDTPSDLFDRMRAGDIHVVEFNPTDPQSILRSGASAQF